MPSTSRRPAARPPRVRSGPAGRAVPGTLPDDSLRELLYWLRLNRALETRLASLFRQGKVLGGLYRSLGQEAISVGSAFALEKGDWYAPVIRNMGTCLVRGIQPRILIAQYMARSVPVGGRDNALHFGFVDQGMVSTISPLGGLVSVMAGVAMAFRMRGEDRVALTYSGDGQTSTGAWHEGVNFAAVQQAPFVLIVENNGWAYSTPVSRQCLLENLSDRAAAYGIPGVTVDGNDVVAVYEATKQAVVRARAGDGPTLIEAKTFRRLGHSEHDDPRKYVPAGMFAEWEKKDPIERHERLLLEAGLIRREEIEQMDRRIEAELDEAQAWAEACPPPDPATLMQGVYAED
ncbi:MAG TPA: thiamine pyrophosphate-dependent dehydrogenase E1 component subunit alpha [Candidatus Polarisedimenticolia bacterium]|nr:thiamine pyrophosphate-dependent dehydrogenase E1 component subunit alpha [Candidatus Polarisedimenticolia bacterium]